MFVRVTEASYRSSGVPAGRTGDRIVEIHPRGDGRYRVRLAGRLPRGFTESLCRGLARRGLSVVRGFARLDASGRWLASFDLERDARGDDPLLVDVLALVSPRSADAALPPFAVEGHRVEALPDGALRLDVTAPDRLGFLGGLLERLSFLGLVPEEMAIDTRAGRAHDVFVLRTRRGGPPTDATRRLLGEVLEGRLLQSS